MNLSKKVKQDFAMRLSKSMIDNGYLGENGRPSSKALSENSGCSVQMARRYIAGTNLPPLESVEQIANWLKVDPYWLYQGRGTRDTLSDCKILTEILLKLHTFISPHEKISTYTRKVNSVLEIWDRVSRLDSTEEEKFNFIAHITDSIICALEVEDAN